MSSPWDDFDAPTPQTPQPRPERASTSAWDDEPSVTQNAPQPSAQSGWDDIIAPPAPPLPESASTSAWDDEPAPPPQRPGAVAPDDLDWLFERNAVIRPPQGKPRRSGSGSGKRIGIIAAAVLAVIAVFAGLVWFLSGAVASGKAPEQSATPSPTKSEVPQAPLSALSSDPSKDLSFDANITLPATGKLYLSNATTGFSSDGSGWTRNQDAVAKGYAGYDKDGCSVFWTQRDQDFGSDQNDYSATISVIESVTGGTSYDVAEYPYWTEKGGANPVGKAEVLESVTTQDGKKTNVAARAVTKLGQVSLIWSTCQDESKLPAFAKMIRSGVGFILVEK